MDNHISPIIAKWLKEATGFEVKSSYILKLEGLTDFEIYQKAKEYGNVILVSKGSDITEIISVFGSPLKLINLKTGNCDNKILFEHLKNKLETSIRLLLDFKKDIIEINPL